MINHRMALGLGMRLPPRTAAKSENVPRTKEEKLAGKLAVVGRKGRKQAAERTNGCWG
jgi:hypothetical protein